MKLSQLRNVVAVIERGGLHGAARALGVAQPAISRSIQELERELGVKLFERTRLGIVLTQVGEMFFRRKGAATGVPADAGRGGAFEGLGYGAITLGLSTAANVALLPKVSPRSGAAIPRSA